MAWNLNLLRIGLRQFLLLCPTLKISGGAQPRKLDLLVGQVADET